MLAFYLNNKPFVLDLNSSIRLTWVNPACNFDEFPGDVGMGITIPVTNHNSAMLGNPERFERLSTENDNEFQGFVIRYSGVLLMSGTLVIHSASSESYNGWLRSNVGNIGKLHREKYIYDINAFAEDKAFENKADYDPLVDPYGCPKIFNPEFFYDKGRKVPIEIQVPNPDYYEGSEREAFIPQDDETEAFSEAFRKTANYFVNNLNPDNTVVANSSTAEMKDLEKTMEVTVVSPMLFLNYVIETILKDANFFIDNNFISSDNDLKKLIMYGNYDISTMTFKVPSVTMPVGDWHVVDWHNGGSVQNYVRIVNEFIRDYSGSFKFKDLLPKIKLKDFVLSIQNLLNVCFHFRHDGKVDIIDREEILTNPAFDIGKYMINQWEITEKKDVTLKFTFQHDDDDTIFKERWEDVDDVRMDEKEPVNDLADLENLPSPQMGEVRYIRSMNIYMQYSLVQEPLPDTGGQFTEDTLGWMHLAIGFQNGYVNYGKDVEEEIATKFSSLVGQYGQQTVMTFHRGNVNSMKFAYQNFTPRLLFYNGNNTAHFETPNISLDWEKEETGLLKTRYPKWAKFWSTRQPVKGKAQIPLNVLDYMVRNLTQKYRCEQGDFIIEEMQTEFNLNGIGTTSIKGYKIAYTPTIFPVESKWNVNDMVMDDSLIDFSNYYLIVDNFQIP